ncbi:NAD-dependent epimerase/dehydratase family protein [Arthrobacter sp. G119Y2]|uniref:NAD-dependent epimerase/dehydratase family protein n=1 Tax=Arthrobacter sp. G119Y2 TaxID=3134965 RepID=UPI003119683C
MIAVVTGVAGFIGSTLARELLERGYQVRGIDSISDYYDAALKYSNLEKLNHPNFEFVEGDLNSLDIQSLISDAIYIFHQAGQPGVRKSWGDDFGTYIEANIGATQRLLEACKVTPTVKKLVYASSSSVYGEAEGFPTTEYSATKPRSPYGVTKLAAEHLCSLYASNFGVPTVSLRYFTVYGPGQRPDMAFTRFVRAAVLDEEIVIYGDGEQIRDFTYVSDIVAANIMAAEGEQTPGTVYNVAGGSSVSVLEVLTMLREISGKALKVRHEQVVAGDVFRTGGATSKIQEELGWSPKISLRDGLDSHYQWAMASFKNLPLSGDSSTSARMNQVV